MVWWPFAPQLERADTTEVIDLNNGAPPLHSASLVRSPWGRVSSRCKSGHGSWLCAHVVIPDV